MSSSTIWTVLTSLASPRSTMPRCATRFTSARCSSSSRSRSSRYYLLGLAGHEAVPPPFSWPAAARNRDGWGCNGGTRDLIQINESMPITLSIVLAAIERRLKCQQRFLGRNASFAHGRLSSAEASDVVADDGSSGEAPDLPRHSYDASLLFRHMAALQIDRDELASNDPLLFRELQGL